MAMDQDYNQFAVSDLLKSPGNVLKQNLPEATPYQLPISGPGNITFPSGYGVKQTESPIASAMEKFYNSTPSERFQATPIKYNATDINTARYMSSPDYFKLGISLYGDNEERYGQNQSWGEVLSNGYAGSKRLAANGFVDTWKGWVRMIDALGHWDWDRLKGDAQSMMELDKAMNDAMNDNPIYATQEGTDTFWNRQMVGNFLQQGGFTFGALAATASEWVVTKAIEAGLAATGIGAGAAVGLEAAEEVKTAASLGRIGRMFQKTKEFYDAAKNTKALKKLGDIWKEESVIKDVFSKIGQKIPGVDIGMEMYQAGKTGLEAGLSGTKIASDIARVGVGGLKRTMSEANFAFTEARMEAAGTFSDLYSQMQQQYYTDHGVYATGSELQKMQNLSMEAADKNFNFNSGVLLVSNRIQFDNIFKGSKVLSKILSKFGDDAVEGAEDILKVTGKVNGRNTIQYYTDGVLSNYKKISETFGKTKALTVTAKSILKPILQFEASEGIQEILQEGSNEYYKDYYLDLYRSTYNPEIEASSEKSLDKAIESQQNMQGLKTFASGALTGMMIHGPVSLGFKMLKKANIKIKDSYAAAGLTGEKRDELLAKRKEARESYKGYYAQFNAIAKDPSKFFPEAIKNFNIQKEGTLALDEATKAGDKFAYENIRTDMLHSAMTQAYRNNTHEALIDTLREYGKHMTKEEFEQAFVGVDYTSENKKTTQDYTDRIANSLESYVKSRKKLDEKFSGYANPNRYEYGSKKWFDESYKKKVLDDMLDVLAGNEFKATDTLNRSREIFSNLSKNKAMGASLATAYNILGSKENIINEKSLLKEEINGKKEILNSLTDEDQKSKLQKEIDLKQEQLYHLITWTETTNWDEDKTSLISVTDVNRSYTAFRSYLDSKNKENGRYDNFIKDDDAKESYSNLIDYIKLNKKAGKHVEAINMLSNPTYFEQIHKRMVKGAKSAYLELAHEAAAEYIKQKGGVPENEHFILEVSGQFGIFNPNGVLISLANDADEAEKIKEELDEKVYGKKKPEKESKEKETSKTETTEEVSDEFEKEETKGDYDKIINGIKRRSEINRTGEKIEKGTFDPLVKELGFLIGSYNKFYNIANKIIQKRDEELSKEGANEDEIISEYDKILEDLKKGIIPEFLQTKKETKETKEADIFSVNDVIEINGDKKATIVEVRKKESFIEYDFQFNDDIENKELSKEELKDKIKTIVYDINAKKYLDFDNGELIDEVKLVTPKEEIINEEEEIADESSTNYVFIKFPETDAELLDSSVKPKLTGNKKIIGAGKAGLFVVKVNNIYNIYDRYGNSIKAPNTTSAITDISEEDAFQTLDKLADARIKEIKNKNNFFNFSGKTIKYGQVLKNNYGKYYVVLSYGEADKNNRIKLQRINYKDGKYELYKKQYSKPENESDLLSYNYVYKKETTLETKYKIKNDNFFQTVRLHRQQLSEDKWQTDAEAQKDLDELLINTSLSDLEKNIRVEIVKIPKGNRKEGRIAGGKSKTNENLIEDGPQVFSAKVYYGDKIIGYISTENYFVIKNKAGKTVNIDEMDYNTFKSIFDVEEKDGKQLMQNFVASYKMAKSLFYKIEKDLNGGYDITYSGKDAMDLFGFMISPGNYAFYENTEKSKRTTFNNLDYNKIDGHYVILDTATRKGADKGTYSIITSAIRSSDSDSIRKQIENEISKNPDILKYLGRYVSVIKLPNGIIKFVELTTKPILETELSSIVDSINSQSEKTKKQNTKKESKQVVEKGKIITKTITEGSDKTFNTDFNDQLKQNIFIKVLKETGFTMDLELNPTGNLKINVSKLNRNGDLVRRAALLTSENDTTGLNFKDVNDFIDRLNKAIIEHDNRIPFDRSSEKIGVELSIGSFKQSLPDTSKIQDFLNAELLTPVAPNVVKNIKLNIKPNVEIIDDILTEKDIEDKSKKEVGKKSSKKANLKVEKIEDEDTETPPPFEVSTSSQQQGSVNDNTKTTIERLNERLDSYGNAKLVLSSDFYEGERPKGRLNAFKSSVSKVADNLIVLGDLNLNEFDFISEQDKKRLDALRPLAEELRILNMNDISSNRRTVDVEKRYAQLTNQLANEFVDIIGKYVKQQLGKTISSSKPRITTQQQGSVKPTVKKEKNVEIKKETDISDIDKYNDLIKEKQNRIEELKNQFIKAGNKKLEAKTKAEKIAAEEYNSKIEFLANKYKGRGGATKVIEQDNFTEASSVDITEFKKWISKNFPDFISVEEMDMLETNMKKGMVTVGMFTAYMKILQDGSKSVAGKIKVGANTPFKYHEAFHAIFRLMLSEEKIENYLKLAKEEELTRLKGDKVKYKELINELKDIHPLYSTLSEKELEERYLEEKMADRFDEWKTNKQVKTHWSFKTFFAKLIDFIKSLFRRHNKNEIDALFNQINNGKFKNAKLQQNRFTKEDAVSFTEPAYKVIKIGEELVQDENKNTFVIERYLSQSKSDKLASTIASIYHRRSYSMLSNNNNQYNKKELLNKILDDYKNLYDFENTRSDYYDELFETYSELEFEEKYKELKQYYEIFSNSENRKVLMESVDIHLKIMGYKSELESDEYEELIDDYGDRVTTDSWKETHSIGGFGSLSQELRQYIASTTMEYTDEFGNENLVDGERLIEAVNANLVYNGILKAISNISNQNKIVRKLSLLASDETETGKFINKFINDVGLIVDKDGFKITNDENADIFQKVIKGFQQYNVDYIFINKDIRYDKKISKIFYANRKDSSKAQFTQWQNAYITTYEKLLLQTKTKKEKQAIANEAASAWDNFNNLINSSVKIDDDILEEESQLISNKIKNTLGISITPMLIKFSIISQIDEDTRSIEQQKLYDAYQDASYITSEQVKEIARTIRSLENPFAKNVELKDGSEVLDDTEEEDDIDLLDKDTLGKGGAIRRLNEIAKANALFDETVYTTSFKNSEGELVYSHQLPTYNLTKVTDLNDEEVRDVMMNDSFLKNNYLLNSPEFQALFGELRVERIDGLKSSLLNVTNDGDIIENKTLEINQLDGVTYGKFGSREFATAMLDLYSFNKKKMTEDGKIFYTSNHLIRVLEASNTGDTIALAVNKTVKRNSKKEIVLNDDTQIIFLNEILNELERIKEVKKEIKNYEEFGILPKKGLIEGYHYKLIEDKETKELIRDFTKGRGVSFYKMQNIIGDEISTKLISAFDKDENFEINLELEKEIKNQVNSYFKNQLDQYLNLLVELNIISKDENNNYSNNLIDNFIQEGFTKNQDGELIEDEIKNQELNIKVNDIEHNIWQIFVNDYVNTLSLNQLLLGDEALSFKDAVDQVKRAKGSNGSGPNAESIITSIEYGIKHKFTKCHITVMDDPKFIKKYGKNNGKTGDKADAQMYMTPKGARYMKFGLGRLTKQQVKALDKIEKGEKLTEEEIFGADGLISKNGMFNSEKLVYFDGQIYIKTSAVILTKELTSRFDKATNKWVAQIGREDLHKMREEMEAFENKNNSVSIIVPSSASKGLKRNVIRNVDEFNHQDIDQFTEQKTKYWRLQVENPSNKLVITDPTQAKQLITAEQDDDLDVYFSWNSNGTISKTATPIKMKQLKEMYYSDTSQRIKNNYTNARNEIFDIENAISELSASKSLGKITPKLGEFQKRAIETLKSTGADSQLIEFFSIDENNEPVYNLNNPLTLDKYTQLFLAYFSKGVMSEKIPGTPVALMSNYGIQVVKRFTGKYTESGEPIGEVIKGELVNNNPQKYENAKRMQDNLTRTFDNLKEGDYYVDDLRHNVPEFDKNGNITGYYSEFMLPPHFRELLRLVPEDAIPDIIQKAFGVRIPTQDKHSFINLKMVDYLPSFMGSTGIFPHELIEISGADFDIDKLYIAIHDFYIKDNNFIAYGSSETDSEKYEEYIIWNLKNNKEFKKYFKELKLNDASYQKASNRISAIKSLRNELKKFISQTAVGPSQLTKEYLTAVNCNKLINDFINDTDELMFTSSDNDFNFVQNNFNKLLNDIEKWDSKEFIIQSKKEELKSLVKTSKSEFDELKDAEKRLIIMALSKFNMPMTTEDFIEKSKKGELNNGVLNNRILDTKIALFGNSKLVTGKDPIAFEPATVDELTDLVKELTDLFVDQSNPEDNVEFMKNILIESGIDVDNLLGKLKSFTNNKEGAKNIGAAVNAMLGYNVLNTFKINLRKKNSKGEFSILKFDNNYFDTYENTRSYNPETKKFDGLRIAGVISTLVSAMTDNAKERLAAKLGLNMEALGYVSNMVALGVPLKSSVMYMLQPVVLEYFKTIKVNSSKIKTSDERQISKKKLLSSMLYDLSSDIGEDFNKVDLNNDLLIKNIKQEGSDKSLQLSVLMDFAIIVNQTDYFNKISQVLKLTKGLGTSWESKNKIDQNIKDLGIKLNDIDFEKSDIPIDVRQIFLGLDPKKPYNKFMKSYINISDQIEYLSKTVFIEKTDIFNKITDIIYDNFFISNKNLENFSTTMKKDIISYLCIRAYMKKLKDNGNFASLNSLDNALIYDALSEKKDPATFADIIQTMNKIREELPNNYLANNFLNVLKTYKTDFENNIDINEYNKDGINKVESNTWAKLSEYQQEKLLDSFIEIYQNDNIRQSGLATSLFHYLLVKDGGQFKSGSFIKFVPNFMFKTLMDSATLANDILRKEDIKNTKEDYKDVFGYSKQELMNDFLNIYTSSVGNELFIKELLNMKMGPININTKNLEEEKEIKEALKEHNEKESLKITDNGIYIDLFAGVRDYMIPVQTNGKITMVVNPKLKEKFSTLEQAKRNKNLEYIKSKGFIIEYFEKGIVIHFPTEVSYKDKKNKIFYRLTSINKFKSDKEYAIDNPLDFIDIESGETIAKGFKAKYVKIEKRGSKKQTKIAHMFGKPPIKGQLPTKVNMEKITFIGYNPEYDQREEYADVIDINEKAEPIATKKIDISNKEISKKLQSFGITYKIKNKKFVFEGDVWDGLSDENKKVIKTPLDLLRLLGDNDSIILYEDEDDDTPSYSKKIVKKTIKKDSKNITVFEQADNLPFIESNYNTNPKDYSRGMYKKGDKWINRDVRSDVKSKFSGKKIISTIDMIKAGLRTRTTRTENWVNNLMDELGIENPKNLIGLIIKQVDQYTGEYVYTRITDVNEFNKNYQDKTWELEGWVKSVTDNLLYQKNKNGEQRYKWAIEFEAVKPDYGDYKGVEKIISGMQTGVDTQVGLDVATELDLKTGGTAPKNFKTQEGSRPQLAKKLNVKEPDDRYVYLIEKLKNNWSTIVTDKMSDTNWYDEYYARNVYNILDSDATVIFAKDIKSTGTQATIMMLEYFKKKYIVNPTAKNLSEFLEKNEVRTLNVAGNRMSKLGKTETEQSKIIKTFKETLKNSLETLNSKYESDDVIEYYDLEDDDDNNNYNEEEFIKEKIVEEEFLEEEPETNTSKTNQSPKKEKSAFEKLILKQQDEAKSKLPWQDVEDIDKFIKENSKCNNKPTE